MPARTAVRVISLESALKRRLPFSRDAEAATIPWEFFPAYTSATTPLAYDERKAIRRFGRALSPGEIGCYTSHYKLWEWLAGSTYDQAFIFEDDVRIDWPAIAALAKYDFASVGLDFFRLFATHGFKANTAIYRFLSPHHQLLRIVGLHLGNQGYLVTRRGAAKLCKNASPITPPSDLHSDNRCKPLIMFPLDTSGTVRMVTESQALFSAFDSAMRRFDSFRPSQALPYSSASLVLPPGLVRPAH